MALPDAKTIEAYRRDGAVLIKGLWADWVGVIRDGIARNRARPGGSSTIIATGSGFRNSAG